VFNQADGCHQWMVGTFPLECRYPRIPIQMRYLGIVIPSLPRAKSAAEVSAGALGTRQQAVCDNVVGRPCYRLSESW
jgi:hypothetical protein